MDKITIIILNYNGWEDTIECLQSLVSTVNIKSADVNLVVVDNNSINDSSDRIRVKMRELFVESFTVTDDIQEASNSKIVLFNSHVNLGFSGGNNIGIKIAEENKSDYALLLNNDTVVEHDFLPHLLEAAKKDGVGMVGPKIVDYYDHNQYILGGEFKKYKCTSVHHYNTDYYSHKPVSFLSGCCWLINMSVVQECGLMDEEYFLYVEDVDYCYRICNLGYKLIPVAESVIYHKEGRSTAVKPSLYYYNTRNRLYFCKKNNYDLFTKACFYSYITLNRIYVALKNRETRKFIKQAFSDFNRSQLGALNF